MLRSRIWVVVTMLAWTCWTHAQLVVTPVESPNRFFAAQRSDIKVDGNLSEWGFDGPGSEVVIDAQTAALNPGPIDSVDDLSARVRLAWHKDQLFLAARVRDQDLKPQPTAKSNPWDCDSLMIVLSTFAATKANPRYQQRGKEPFFGFSYRTDDVPPRQWSPNSSYVVRRSTQGYDIEAVMSLSDIGYDVRPGDRIKMCYILSDLDGKDLLTQLTAGMNPGPVPVDIAQNYYFDLRFVDDKPYAGELLPVQATLQSGQPLELNGQVDVLDRPIEVVGVRIRDASGKVVAQQAGSGKLESGRRYLLAGKLDVASLPPGAYDIALVVKDKGQESNGGVHGGFEIVKRVEAADTMVGTVPDLLTPVDPYRVLQPSLEREYRPMTITRDDYLAVVRKVQTYWKARMYDKGRDADVGIYGGAYAQAEYVLYKAQGDRQHLEAALGLMWHMHEAHLKSAPHVIWTQQYRLVQWLLADPDVPEKDKVWLREVMPRMISKIWSESKPTEWGAFNRAMLWGILCDWAVKEIPNSPDVPRWKEYAELQWSSWWPYRDHDENSTDYNCWSILDILDWAKYRDASSLKDPGIVAMAERYMLQMTPAGAMPGYGDASPWNASAYYWIPVFERMATETRDGRFKWAARRLLEYNLKQMDELMTYHGIFDGAAMNCALAWLYADESIAEVQPDGRSALLQRKAVLPVTPAMRQDFQAKYGITGLFYHLGQEKQPDKLVLRSGNNPFSANAMIELCSNAGHQMSTVPNIAYFMKERAVLLTDQGYMQKGPEYHNVIFVEDLTGITPEGKDEQISVPMLSVGSNATYTQIKVDWYKGWPVTNERQVLFTHEGPMLVKDLVTFHKPFVAQVRQQWHTRVIGPGNGNHWVNSNIPFMLHSGIGQPGAATRWYNPPWDLLIFFTPQADRECELLDRSRRETPWNTAPLRFSQRWRGMPTQDEPLHFTTLLWPHKPELDGSKYGKAVTVLNDSVAFTAVAVDVSDTRRLVLGANDSGQVQTIGPVATDARAFLLEFTREGDQLTAKRIFATATRSVAVNGKNVHQSSDAKDFDKGL
jgi:hypothetical protein